MPKAVNNGVLFLSAKDLLNDGTINFTVDVKMISEEDFLRLSRKALPQKNDIIYSRIGACLGKARVVTRDIRFLVSYSCCTIRPVIIDSTFLASILDGNFVLDQAKKETQSVGVPDLGMASIKQFLIPIPPLVEQQRIDERLQYTLNIVQQISNECDDLRRVVAQTKSKILDLAIRGELVPQDPNDEPASVLLERIRAEKKELIKQGNLKCDKKESVIFRGDDNSYYQNLPEMWELVNFKDCATLISGRDLNKNEYNAESIGIPYITGASNFINGNILINRWTTVPKTISEVNDILITCKGTVGELAINTYGNIHIARQIMAIRVYKNISLKYIKLFLESIVMEIKKTANGLIPGISRDDMLSVSIPLPPLAEQKRIVDAIEKIFATLDDIANQVA